VSIPDTAASHQRNNRSASHLTYCPLLHYLGKTETSNYWVIVQGSILFKQNNTQKHIFHISVTLARQFISCLF